MARSAIEWTESTWNPVTGCDKISPGCKHCYAETMARRLQGHGPAQLSARLQVGAPSRDAGEAARLAQASGHLRQLHVGPLPQGRAASLHPARVRRHETCGLAHLPGADEACRSARASSPRNCPGRPTCGWASVWNGRSTPSASTTCGGLLLQSGSFRWSRSWARCPALDLAGIDWVIVGGESGPGARPMDPAWASDLRDQCRRARVPFFFKQWGGRNKKAAGRMLEGRTWDQSPRTGSEISSVV